MSRNKPLIVILGPTASGKSRIALKLAEEFGGEIISADSREVYKEANIGIAKPASLERKKIPHHLIGIVKPDQDFNVAIYKQKAIKAIKKIQNKNKLPILTGGTGLYIKAVVQNIQFPEVKPHPQLRKKLNQKDINQLFKIYKELDPQGAKHIDKNNKRRLIRAIEVSKISGRSFWEQRGKGESLFETLKIGIKLPELELNQRIKDRVEQMFKLGLEEEVRKLVRKYGWKAPVLQSIGYQEWKEYFEGKITKKEVKSLIQRHTIQFAKRQITWFKSDPQINWIKTYPEAKKLVNEFLK